jgi:glycosyltransferase involved in cell wall biosynthesis
VSHWIRAEHLITDFECAFAPHFDLSSQQHRGILSDRQNVADNYIRSIEHHFTSKELEHLYSMNPAWATLESKLYGDIVRLPTMTPPAIAAEAANQSIAAIIPLYNGAAFIEEAIHSVLSQTIKPDEFLIVDDGSTDDGPDIVKRFAQTHLTLIKQTNGGQSSARNCGVRHSTSSLIAFLDQDDAWHPHHLEELLGPFKENRGIPIGWSYSNLDEIDEQGRLVNRGVLNIMPAVHPKRSLNACLSGDMFILPSASLISRQAFDAVGGFDERLSGYEDDDLFLRMFRSGYENVYINQSLSKWRMYSSSSSFSNRMRISRMIYFNKLCNEYETNKSRNLFYARDLLAPRFIRGVLSEYERSVNIGNKERMIFASDDLWAISKHLSTRRRLAMMTFSLIARNMTVGLLAKATYRFLRRSGFPLF